MASCLAMARVRARPSLSQVFALGRDGPLLEHAAIAIAKIRALHNGASEFRGYPTRAMVRWLRISRSIAQWCRATVSLRSRAGVRIIGNSPTSFPTVFPTSFLLGFPKGFPKGFPASYGDARGGVRGGGGGRGVFFVGAADP